MKKLVVLALISTLCFSACGTKDTLSDVSNANKEETMKNDITQVEENTNNENDTTQVEEDTNNENDTTQVEENTKKETGFELFAELPDKFYFSSGAGGWATELYLEDDGTFYGQYHDSDMGDAGKGYPNGHVYLSDFKGKFTAPKKISEYVYSTTLEYLNFTEEREYIEDGVKYTLTDPYGLEDAGEFLIYLHDAPLSELTESFMSWTHGEDLAPDWLQCYGLYNVNTGAGFTGYRTEDMEQLKKLDGMFVNEAGDKMDIRLAVGLDDSDSDLGEVEWMPHDEESEIGNIKRNQKGGFTIYLDESISYDFEITDYTYGKIKVACVNKLGNVGTFVMQ